MFLQRFNRLISNNISTLRKITYCNGRLGYPNGSNTISYSSRRTFNSQSAVDDGIHITENEMKNIFVHARILKIGEIDTMKKKFHVDALLTMRWKLDDNSVNIAQQENLGQIWDPEIYVHNLEATSNKSNIELEQKDGKVWFTQKMRINGNVQERFDLHEFPFDLQDLGLYLTSKKPVNILDDSDKVHTISVNNFTDESEWHIFNYVKSQNIAHLTDTANFNGTPNLMIQCRIFRKSFSYVSNVFLIILMIAGLGFLSYIVDMPLVESRLLMVFTLILALILLKGRISTSLPKIPYLTYIDKFLLMAMSTLGLCSLTHSIPCDNILKSKEYLLILAVASFYGFLMFFFALQLIKNPVKKWRLMKLFENIHAQKIIKMNSKL